MARLFNSDFRFLRMLELSPFERRLRGGWRFGARRIADSVVERLIASGADRCADTTFPLLDGPLLRTPGTPR